MRKFALGPLVAVATVGVSAAPASALGPRSVAPDGRSDTPLVAGDTDGN